MYTNCPTCARQFRIRASQLSVAEGMVQCGFCGKQFNALERLYDKPQVIDTELPESVAESEESEPEFFIPEAGDRSETTGEPERITEDPEQSQSMSSDSELHNIGAGDEDASEIEEQSEELSPVEFPFPEELEEPRPSPGILSRLIWSGGTLLLILITVMQLAWFNRDFLLERYPEYLPQAKIVCAQFDCELIRNRNVFAIKLINRDVRVHPRYEDALLVNATITNLSSQTQIYPRVFLSLFDSGGAVMAYRLIKPEEYLDSSIDIEAGMPSNTPVHFALELANRESDAVSFEFEFL